MIDVYASLAIVSFVILSICFVVLKYVVLIYDLKFQRSHVQFVNTVAEILIDDGYDVVILSNVVDERLVDVGSKRARRIVAPQTAETARLGYGGGRMNDVAWTANGFYQWYEKVNFNNIANFLYSQCSSILSNHHLMNRLRNEQFDAALVVNFDLCIYHILHTVGIRNFGIIDSHSTIPQSFHFMSVPQSLSYVPGRFGLVMDSEMTLNNRLGNFVRQMFVDGILNYLGYVYERKLMARFPYLTEISANASYVFINRDPQIDFPTLTTHRIVDVGGMTMTTTNKTLHEDWSSIFDLRSKTVMISFGTIGNSADMPSHFKQSLLQTFQAFPDVTFVWKYEKPAHNISRSIDNLIEAQWLPQKEMLADRRLSAFITHCGLSSTYESMHAGVPIIAIPTISDQYRNALMFKRNGGGIVMDKEDLGNSKKMIAAVREILYNPEHSINARRVASRLASSPVSSKENFLRHFEFLVKFGPLHHLKHVGATQSFVQYYSIDVIAIIFTALLIVATTVFGSVYFITRKVLRVSSLFPLLVFSLIATQSSWAEDSQLYSGSNCKINLCYVPGTCDRRIDSQLRIARYPLNDCQAVFAIRILNRNRWEITLFAKAPANRIVVNWINGLSFDCRSQEILPTVNEVFDVSNSDRQQSTNGMLCHYHLKRKSTLPLTVEMFKGSTGESPFELLLYSSDPNAKPTTYVGYTDVVRQEIQFRLPDSLVMDWSICLKDTCFADGMCEGVVNSKQFKYVTHPKSTCKHAVIIHPVSKTEWQITIFVLAGNVTNIRDVITFSWAGENMFECFQDKDNIEEEFERAYEQAQLTVIHSEETMLYGYTKDARKEARFDIDFNMCYGCVPACEGCFDSTRVKYKPGPCESYSCIDPDAKMLVNNRFSMKNKLTCNNSKWHGETNVMEDMRMTDNPHEIGQLESLTRIECSKELDCQRRVRLLSTCNEMKNGVCTKVDVTKRPFDPKCAENYVLSILIRRIYNTKKEARTHVDKVELTSLKCDSAKGEWRMEYSERQKKNWYKLKEGDLIVCLREGTKLEDLYADKKAEIHHVKENFPVAQVTLYALAIVFGREEAEELPEGTPVVEPNPILTIQKIELKRKLAMFAT
ncbi:hypothetical protein PRIPAC_90359 [Pristionchus pacificus]|uniref:glucuronosyltransferase n=1 Tax=Pristionchus pacificus TaxID=54126 RepID=A0A2A6CXG7_PRIPA|nr:hypothetical protein PRIPAC_90359 [Pristionchus pacificus]|eukprot:PDM82912.1 Glycosyltransferase [Pristionchus pacificus]